jgi:hypothetical protein
VIIEARSSEQDDVDDLITEIYKLSVEAASLKAQAASIRRSVVELMRDESDLTDEEMKLLRNALNAADSMVWALSHADEER